MGKIDLTKMSKPELTQYILDNRGNEEELDRAIRESSSRPGWTEVPADTPAEEEQRIIEELIARKANS
jgi:hypothetical protein